MPAIIVGGGHVSTKGHQKTAVLRKEAGALFKYTRSNGVLVSFVSLVLLYWPPGMISFSFCSAAIAASTTASRLDRDASSCSACACVCVCVCMRATVYVRMCVCVHVWECMSGKREAMRDRETEGTMALTCLSAGVATTLANNGTTLTPRHHLGQGTKDKCPPVKERRTHRAKELPRHERACSRVTHAQHAGVADVA